MYDINQVEHIKEIYYCPQAVPPKETPAQKRKNKIELSMMLSAVGIIVAIAGQYAADIILNIIAKKPFHEIFRVRGTWQEYYASVIAGGINGMLLVYLPPKLFSIAAVLIVTVVYETIAQLTGLSTRTDIVLVRSIVRDIFLILLVIDVINKVTGNNVVSNMSGGQDNSKDEPDLLQLIDVTFISSLVINIALLFSRFGINRIFNFETGAAAGGIVENRILDVSFIS